jgi:penicillin amidase
LAPCSYRQIVNMAQLNMSLYVNPPGQSGNTLSVSYDDQLHAWVEGGYLPLAFDVLAPEHHLLLLP